MKMMTVNGSRPAAAFSLPPRLIDSPVFLGRRSDGSSLYLYQAGGNEQAGEKESRQNAGDQQRGDRDIGQGADDDGEDRWRNDRGEAGTGQDRADRQFGVVAAFAHDRQQRAAEHGTDRDGRAGQRAKHRR